MERDEDPAAEMVHELGIDPALEVDSDQRAELLRRWHQEDAERDAERKKRDAKS
jgi:hypothetical protein